jgi:hypothetical protein
MRNRMRGLVAATALAGALAACTDTTVCTVDVLDQNGTVLSTATITVSEDYDCRATVTVDSVGTDPRPLYTVRAARMDSVGTDPR